MWPYQLGEEIRQVKIRADRQVKKSEEILNGTIHQPWTLFRRHPCKSGNGKDKVTKEGGSYLKCRSNLLLLYQSDVLNQ
jgi:hypothetical protein